VRAAAESGQPSAISTAMSARNHEAAHHKQRRNDPERVHESFANWSARRAERPSELSGDRPKQGDGSERSWCLQKRKWCWSMTRSGGRERLVADEEARRFTPHGLGAACMFSISTWANCRPTSS